MAKSDIGLEERYIDIEKVVAAKNPKLARWMPGFVFGLLKRLIHQKDLNELMSRVGHHMDIDFLEAVLKDLDITLKLIGSENVPKEGGLILSANHPLGGIDGMSFMLATGRIRGDFQFLVNDMLLNIKNLEKLFVPVNKVGSNPRQSTILIEEAYAKDIAILVFPSGLVSRKLPSGVQDLDWKKSFIQRAKKYHKDIVPVHIDGQNSKGFYNFSRLRQSLGIKANLEMGLLADELFKQRGNTITVRFGKPVPYTTFDSSKTPTEWAAEMRRLTYELPNIM